ncbi:MAG: MBG domain-containing protein [Terracidiphilus sp.]
MTNLSAGSPFSACFAVPSIAAINSPDGQCSPLIETSQRGGAWARGVARFRAALMIKLGSVKWMTSAAIVALTLVSGSTSWAQSCPTSPSYSPDFSSNQSCLQLNGGASFAPGASPTTLLQLTRNTEDQVGSAWYTTPQPVANTFSSTFTFQLTGGSADGFAFVIQNSSSGINYVGYDMAGCALGYAGDPLGVCGTPSSGVTNSVAVGFKTYNDGTNYPNANSVFIASNETGENCENVGTGGCVIAENNLGSITLANGNVHMVTVTYAIQPLSSQTACVSASMPCLDVILDGTDLFPAGVPFDMTSIDLTNNAAFVGFTGATGNSVENNDILSWTFTPQSFGNVNVCPSGQTTPAPCSATQTVTFSIPANTTIGSVNVVTQGTSGLDFSLPSAGTCTGPFSTAGTCTVNVTFAPQAPGLRTGAVNLFPGSSPSGTPLATMLIYGVGQGPAIAFSPGTQSTVNTGGNSLILPNGVAVDAAGDIFIADGGNGIIDGGAKVLKVAPGGGVSSVGSNLAYPQGLAVDGAGNLYIADNDLNEVVKVTPAGVQTEMNFGLNSQLGVAVDGAGDLFVSSYNGHEVVEVPANGGVQTVVYSPGPSSNPIGLAVDAAGDLFIADYGLHEVVEVPANGGAQTTIGTGWDLPEAVAVDAAGDVFVADEAPKVVEVPAGCINNSACQITISGTYAYGVAVDGKGNVYIPDRTGSAPYSNADNTNNQVIVVNKSQPPSLSFAATYEGSTSTDSPQTVSVQNIGNATLDFATISFPTDFPQVGDENDCSTGTPLIPGLVCPLTIEFKPTTLGAPLSEAVGLTDNALNTIPSATQSILVEGNGLSPEVNVPSLSGLTETQASSALTLLHLSLGTVTMLTSSTVPMGEVISQIPAAGMLALVGSSVSVVISSGVAVPSLVGQTEMNADGLITGAGLNVGTVTTQFSDTVPSGTVISQSPAFPSTVSGGTLVSLVVSSGVPPAQDQLTLENNYFVTGDYATGGVTLHGTASGTITIPDPSPCAPPGCGPGVPDGADIIDGFLYWTTIETSATPAGNNGFFLGYSITGQQIGSDVPNYSDGTNTGTLRVYRADVNNYFQVPAGWNGARQGSGPFTVTLPNTGGTITEGASLVVIWRVLSPNFPLKSVVIYDGSIVPASLNVGPIPLAVQGFYDAVGGANGTGQVTHLYTSGGSWNDSESPQTLGQSNQYIDTLTAGNAYAAVILSTPVNNSDNDGILDAWKAAQGYTDVKTGSWVPLPGATHGEQDLFVQFDYMCSAFISNNVCDFTQTNLYPSPDAQGNDPLAMVTQAFASYGVHLHLKPGNAIPESTCMDVTGQQFCEFPSTEATPQPGVVAWNGSVELSKVWPLDFTACTKNPSPATCVPRFPYGQKDSYHYVMFGYSLAIPAWTTRAGSITSITTTGGTNGGTGTIVTTGLGTTCPTRITVSGVQGNPNLNAIYDGLSCDSGLKTITFSTPSTVPAWTYPNTLPEPVIAVTSGTVTSISGYSDLGGSDSVVSLGQWESSPTQDMSKSATVVAGTLFHELGHTLGLSHGGLYFDDTPNSYIPTFEANCKPNYQSSMNYLFQLDGVGPNAAVTYSNQVLYGETQGPSPTRTILAGDSGTRNPNFTTIPFGSVVNLTDASGDPASFTTSAWYTTTPPSSTASAATMHCDGSPLNNDNDTAYRVNGPVDSISPAWSDGQNITFDGAPYSDLRGFNDTTALDLRQVGATSGDFASLANATSYTSGGVTFGGSGGVTFAGSGGVTYGGSGGVTFAGSGGVLFAGSGGVLFAGSGGVTFAGSGGVTYAGSGGVTFAGSGGVTFAGSGGVTFAGSGGVTYAGSGGASTNELDYVTANSFVRPPNSPTITPGMTNGAVTSVTVDWKAPAFGVVQYYTVYRGCNPDGSDAVNIGVVNGVGGAAPATEFIDSNPVTCSGSSTVVYTIATTLAPVPIDQTQRSSAPSVPAIVKNIQTIVLGPLESSVTYSTSLPPVTVTATAETNGNPNGLQVNFVATGPCSVSGQMVASIPKGGASTATVTVNDPGSNPATCTVTASQPGTNPTASSMPPYYDAANSVSESFTIEPAGSNLQSQTISWSTLTNVQHGSTFSLSASSTSGLPVTFTASGPCSPSGATTGVGRCTITASQKGNGTYSPASVSQSFTITPAVLTVTANSLSSPYGTIPTLTYMINGFVNRDPSSAVSGTPALSTTATTGSSPGNYPITISTGSLAAANYSFLFVPGTLTITKRTLTVTANNVTRAYGVANPANFTVGYSGFVNGDTSVAGNPAVTTTAVATSLPGSYPIIVVQGTLTSANYTFNFVDGTLTVTFTGTVPASGTACNGAYSGTFSGNLTVSGTQACIFVGGGASGNITETGGNVLLSNATIGGNVQVSGGTYSIGPSTTIKGNLTVQSIPTGSAQNQICGATVLGSLTLQSVGTATTIGSGSPSCSANTVSGSLTLQANKAAVVLTGNTIKGSVTDQSNTAATTLTGNTISGSLTDQGNSAPSTLSLNSVTGNLVDQSNSASSVLLQNTVHVNMTVQSNTGAAQVTSNKVTGTLVCQSNTSITGSGDTAAKLQGQCASF